MQRSSRSIVVAMLTALLFMNPAIACHNCGWSARTSYYYGGYNSACCGGTVIVNSGCGCGACGCDPCGGCDVCGGCGEFGEDEATVHEHSHEELHTPTPAPQPPAYEPPTTTHKPPVTPAVPAEPAPSLPVEMPPIPPATPEVVAPPAEVEPAETMPAVPPAELPSDDDLFSAPMPEAIPPSADDLDFAPSEPAVPADDNDLFGPSAPAEESKPAPESTEAAPYDDFFGAPAEEEEVAPPADEAEPPADDEDDFFSNSGSILRQPGGLASTELRQWTDDTGLHSCHGRMIKLLDGKVQLLKDNGRTSTVPLARLSKDDLSFVHRQASAKRSEALGQTVQVNLAW